MLRKIEKVAFHLTLAAVGRLSPRLGTKLQYRAYKRWGMQFRGVPNYLSSRVLMDGTDYSFISLGQGVTISSFVRILTHDWAAHTVGKAVGLWTTEPLGRTAPIEIGDFSFVGTGSIVMPGTKIGRGCIIGAGTVVRGTVPDFSIVVGSPGKIVGDSRAYLRKHFAEAEAVSPDDGLPVLGP